MNQIDSNSLVAETSHIARITRVGIVCNFCLTVIKLVIGWFAGSIGLIADGFHSLSDLATDFAVLIGTNIGARPADRNHPFGHGKFETFAVVFVAAALILVGAGIAWKAVSTIRYSVEAGDSMWIIIVALISMVTKEWLFHATRRVADKCRSSALRANAWHHRSDALSSVVVLAGGASILLGWEHGDQVAGLFVGLMVTGVGGKLGFDALMELSESSAGLETVRRIEEIIVGFEEVLSSHKLRVRRVGRELMMDIHIVLDRHLTIQEGHQVVKMIEEAIKVGLDWPITLTIHVDPDSI